MSIINIVCKIEEYLFPFIVVVILINEIWGKYDTTIFILVLFLLYALPSQKLLSKNNFGNVDSSDILILFLLITTILSYFFSINKINSIFFVKELIIIIIFYYWIKINLKYSYQVVIIFFLLACFATYISILTLYSHIVFVTNLNDYNIDDLLSFRYLFLPANTLVNNWGTLILILLPFSIILYFYFQQTGLDYIKYLFFGSNLLTVFSIICLFSKGSLLGLFAFFLSFCAIYLLFRKGVNFKLAKYITLLISGVVLLFITWEVMNIPITKPFLKSLQFVQTTSQQRSFKARLKSFDACYDLVKINPYVGIGANNFSIGIMANQENSSFSKLDYKPVIRPLNHFVHLLIEQGILGLTAYVSLYVYFLCLCIVNIKKTYYLTSGFNLYKVYIFISPAIIIAILIREMSFSSLLHSNDILMILFFIFSCNCSVWYKKMSHHDTKSPSKV